MYDKRKCLLSSETLLAKCWKKNIGQAILNILYFSKNKKKVNYETDEEVRSETEVKLKQINSKFQLSLYIHIYKTGWKSY